MGNFTRLMTKYKIEYKDFEKWLHKGGSQVVRLETAYQNSLKRLTYDPAGRLLQVQYRQSASPTGNVIAESDYTYDAAGNRVGRADLASQAGFTYDGVYELTGDSNSADKRGAQTFAYDLAGNRTQQTLGSQTLSYSTPNNLDRLASAGPSSFQYDAEGNRIQAGGVSGTATYGYDGKGRLSRVTLPNGTVITYAYNWQNKLVSRTKGSEVRTYLYGQNTQVLEETLNGKRYALYGWGPDGLVSRTDANGQSLFYLKDAQGKIMALVDTQDNVVKDNQYSAFGEDLSGKDAVNPFRFVGGLGGRKDDDTGLVYFWNRWYDPSVGRWVTEDPIRQADELNVYVYLGNHPLLGTDLMGLCAADPTPPTETYQGPSPTLGDIAFFQAVLNAGVITAYVVAPEVPVITGVSSAAFVAGEALLNLVDEAETAEWVGAASLGYTSVNLGQNVAQLILLDDTGNQSPDSPQDPYGDPNDPTTNPNPNGPD